MQLKTYLVNAFTEELAAGNPAGVVLYSEDIEDEIMKKIAIDLGKSETAFVRKEDGNDYSIRWFSPKKEMPICGHATLAASKVLLDNSIEKGIAFSSASGKINIEKKQDGSISMQFPIDDYSYIECDDIYFKFFEGITIEDCIIGKRTKKVVLRIDSKYEIESIKPNYELMLRTDGIYSNGIGITKKSNTYDFETRYFNPWAGVNEDPITGSVHTLLAKYWGNLLKKRNMVARQSSYRPGILSLDVENEYVIISGKAKIVLNGIIEI